jgi:hypothetical protein
MSACRLRVVYVWGNRRLAWCAACKRWEEL